MVKHLAAAAATLFAGAVWTCNAIADEVPPPAADLAAPPTRWGNRMLAGHTFLFPVTHAGPFVTTYFGVAQGVYDESIPNVPIPGARTTDLSLIGVTSTADLGIKLTDWLGVEAQGRALAVFGLNGQSLIYAGGQLNSGGYIAPIVRLARVESSGTQISLRAQMGWLNGTSLQVPRLLVLARTAIAGAVQNTSDPTAAARDIGAGIIQGGFPRVILAGADTFNLNASIEAAQALGEMFGLQAAVAAQRRVLGVTLNDPAAGDFRESGTRYDMLVDLSAEWDGMSAHIPIAAILEYELNARLAGTGDEELEVEGGNTHTLGLGVYYSGRPNLQVGLFAATIRNLRPIAGVSVAGSPGTSGTPNTQFAEMVLRYVW
jgi:hypothetical protein